MGGQLRVEALCGEALCVLGVEHQTRAHERPCNGEEGHLQW